VPIVEAESLVEGVRRAGLRVTRPRRAICRILADRHDDHLTAAELHRLAEEASGSPIDPSTVYRTIEALETVGLVYHVHLGHGPSVVHLAGHAGHHHLACDVCGRTDDIPLDELADLTHHIERRYGFRVDGVHFALAGRCAAHDTR
jgi:Fur family ferric uptake transcriptional regulator